MLDKVKTALRVSTSDLDGEITDLLEAAKADLELAGVEATDYDPLIVRAVITYCRCHFSSPTDYDRLKAAYDEQKAQLMMAQRYRGGSECTKTQE